MSIWGGSGSSGTISHSSLSNRDIEGNHARIQPSSSPMDLEIDCGTDKTLYLKETVYNEFIPSVSVLASGAASPDTVNHTIQSVVGAYYSFDGTATEERLTIKIELYHDYKEGSDIEIHVHAMPNDNTSGNAIWYFDYFVSKINSTTVAGSTLSGTASIQANTQYKDYTTSLGTITGTGLAIGDFIIGTLRRTPTGIGDTYGGEMLLKQVAAHCEIDTLGSRTRYNK